MWLYLLIFAVPVFAFLQNTRSFNSVKFLAFFMLFLALFVGLSDMFGGYDRYIYGQLFDQLADDMNGSRNVLLSPIFSQYHSEWGYIGLNWLIAHVTANRYIFILIVTLIIYLLLFFSFKEYFDNYPFGLILFLGLWFFFTFTYLRQVLAVSVGILSIKYAIKRKPLLFFLFVLLAYGFHNSAIILAPFYFIANRKFSKQSLYIILVLCFIAGISGVTSSLYQAYGEMSNDVQRVEKYSVEGSFRIAYFLEAGFFLYFIFKNYNRFPVTDKFHLAMMNMSICFCAILLFFIRSDNGGRLSWFYIIGLMSYFTTLVHRKYINFNDSVVLILLFVFLYMRIYTGWQAYNNLYPYKTFLTNGHRYPDFSWENFEYDHRYDVDKFYR